jgi:hypothetical protein
MTAVMIFGKRETGRTINRIANLVRYRRNSSGVGVHLALARSLLGIPGTLAR